MTLMLVASTAMLNQSPPTLSIDPVVLNPHTIANPQVHVAGVLDHISELPESRRTVIRYREPCACLFSISLPIDGATDRSGDRSGRLAAATADLMPDHTSRQSAEHRPALIGWLSEPR